MSNLERIYSLEEAAEYLRLEPQKIRRLATAKKIGHLKEAHTFTFPESALSDYRDAHYIAPLPGNPHGLTTPAAKRVRS